MRCSSVAVLIAAMGVSQVVAGPTHRHMHRHVKKDLKDVDFTKVDYSGVDWSKVDWSSVFGGKKPSTNGAPAPSAGASNNNGNSDNKVTENKSDVATSSKDDNNSGDLVGDLVGELWHGLVGVSNTLTSFGGKTKSSGSMGDFYQGNVGSPYGSNIIKVNSEQGYTYTNNFINTSGKPMTIVIWNKMGADGQPLSGGATATVKPTLTLFLKPGQNQVVAFDEDTQLGFAQATDEKTFSGHFATSFGECNMTPNGAACNLSAILNPKGNTYKMKITNKENDCVSDETQNCWVTEKQTLPGADGKDRNGSCYIPGGQGGHFTTEMGGQQ